MANPNPHQLVTCPYNKAHQVEHYRIHIHLQKCRRQYPDTPTASCPFDATHVIQQVEMNYHISECPKRNMLDEQIYVLDDEHRPAVQVQPMGNDFECDEDWEEDNVASYQPVEAKKGKPVILKPKGLTPSERRVVRQKGRLDYVAALRKTENQ